MDDEVFSQERQVDRLADLREVGKVALKVFFVCQDGEGIRPGRRVGLRDPDGVEIGRDRAG